MLTSIILVICVSSFVHSNELSSDIPIRSCKKDAEDFGQCTKLALQDAWPRIVAGIPEHKIPPLDPLFIEKFGGTYDYQIIRGSYTARNITVYGIGKSQILLWEPKLENDRFHIKARIFRPKLFTEGEHEFDYESNFMPKVHAEGMFNNSMTNVTLTVIMDGSIIDDRMVLENISITPQVGDVKMWASDLFNGNKEMTATLLAFSNANWRMWYNEELIKIWMKPVNDFVKNFLNKIFATIPFSKIVT